MKRHLKTMMVTALLVVAMPVMAQFGKLNINKAVGGAMKAAQAVTLTDAQMAAYVKESVKWMDEHNPVCKDDNPYTVRLKQLTEGLKSVDGIPLNFKVYDVIDVNAFACPDGSVRVFSSLMDIMSDDELRGVIGHEIGHVGLHHSKKAYRTALMTSAAKELAGAANGTVARLSDSQLGALGESLLNSQFSQKQESEADDYGYDFLKKNGYNPWAISLAFEKLKKMEDDAGGDTRSKMQKMFSSHPDTQKRIKKMAERAEKDGIARP